MKLTLMWPPELIITESVFRHYSGLTEIAGYLKNVSDVVGNSGLDVQIVDCSVQNITSLNLVKTALAGKIICIYVNMNNITEACKLAAFLKSVNPGVVIVVYGEAATCNPELFAKLEDVDYVIGNGQIEYGIEYVVIKSIDEKLNSFYDLKNEECGISGKILKPVKMLPNTKWGMTDFSISPIDEYLELSGGELHLLINKGCPFFCKFCNERLVSANRVYYRETKQVKDFLCDDYDEKVKSVYLDASTFTYNRDWVIELCNGIKEENKHLNWKTCTRLDCVDEELVHIMAEAGCNRISIGVETFDKSIQKDNRKEIDEERLKQFAGWCLSAGIKPRALLIIGLKGQTKDDIYRAKEFCEKNRIDARFRVLQDYDVLIKCNTIDEVNFALLDRWNTWNPFEDMSITELRSLEYPKEKTGAGNYV